MENTNTLIKKLNADLNIELFIKETQMAEKYLRRCSTSLTTGECKSKLLLHFSEWLRSITQVTAHAGEDVEQGEHSSIADGSANLYSHYRNQYGNFSEN